MLAEVLYKFWGYKEFRALQLEIIQNLVAGKDTLAVLPTGGGKSICYQVPAVAAEGMAIVISPLVALMKDQVQHLTQRGIPAAYLSATKSAAANETTLHEAQNGAYKLLFIAPERLLSERFLYQLADIKVSFIAVDEAHCISQWGHDFRPAYRKIHTIFDVLPRVPILALTASAMPSVQQDIISQLRMNNPKSFIQSVARSNISLEVNWVQSKYDALLKQLQNVEGSTIVYCNSRKKTEMVALHLQRYGINAQCYHAGMHQALRSKAQDDWTKDKVPVIVATSAFGMGIDKSDVRQVLHFDAPYFMESYYQEAGRAGRDGNWAKAVVLLNNQDLTMLEESKQKNFPTIPFIKSIYQKVCNFLGITIGEGFEMSYPFSVVQLVRQYQLPLFETIAAIKFLQKDGFWQWNETEAIGASVMFTTDAYSLQQLATMHPELSRVCTTLLRMYGSVFHYPTFIQEYEVAKMLKIDKGVLDTYFHQLQALGFINYNSASNDGTLYFLNQRLPENYVKLNLVLYNKLKDDYAQRVSEMQGYLQLNNGCRSVFIANYFGEKEVQPCNICDNCTKQKGVTITMEAFWYQTKNLLKSEPILVFERFENYFSELSGAQIIKYLRYLEDEGFLNWNKEQNTIKLK